MGVLPIPASPRPPMPERRESHFTEVIARFDEYNARIAATSHDVRAMRPIGDEKDAFLVSAVLTPVIDCIPIRGFNLGFKLDEDKDSIKVNVRPAKGPSREPIKTFHIPLIRDRRSPETQAVVDRALKRIQSRDER